MNAVLFVCTGNTCRSPMAETLFNAMCEKSSPQTFRAFSAGLNALPGQPASPGAKAAMQKRGLSLESHRARRLSPELIRRASLIVCMSEAHAQAVRLLFPEADVPVQALSPAVPDPYGGDETVYDATASVLEVRLSALLALLKAEAARFHDS